MPRVVHFEIRADEPEKAIKFYEDVFKWKFKHWKGPADYWLIETGAGDGINGGLVRKKDFFGITNTINVPSVDEFLKKIKDKGGKIVKEKMPIPGVGWLAFFEDPEGNKFGIIQNDKSVK